MLATLKLDRARVRMISGFIDTYLQSTAEENAQYTAEFKTLSKREKEAVMEITTSWKEEGIRQGLQQGIQQGLQKGREQGREEGLEQGRQQEAVSLLCRLLNRRLGLLQASLLDSVGRLTLEQLEDLSEALLEFKSVDEFEQWLEINATS